MYKFEKNSTYKIGKPSKDSTNDSIVWIGTPLSLPADILMSQSDGTFEDWVINGNHKYKVGTLLICAKMEDGVPVYQTEMSVPNRNESNDITETLDDNLDFFKNYDIPNRYNKRILEDTNNKAIEILESQLSIKDNEIKSLKEEIKNLKSKDEQGLSDNILSKVSLESAKERHTFEKENLQSQINSLTSRVKELEKENKGLSDQVIPEQSKFIMQTIVAALPEIPNLLRMFKGEPQPQIQQPAPMRPVTMPPQMPNISDEFIDGVPNG